MTAPYQQNPLRRLRRLARWLEACGGELNCAGIYYSQANLENVEVADRVDECDRLLGAEIEWACKTTAESLGFDWQRLEDEPNPATQLPEALPEDFCDRSKSEDILDRYDVDQGTLADSSSLLLLSLPLSEPSSPLSTVTAADIAEAIRRILDSAFAAPEVERAHELLERYESQIGGSNG